jgi:hypothetical protein
MADLGLKAVNLHDTFDPVRNLWRNVLVVAISDAIKIKSRTLKFSEFYRNKRFLELDYVTLPNRDFDAVCAMSDLDGNLVRKKINKVMKAMEESDGTNMPTMPWKRLYQSQGFNRESDGNYTPMSAM